jgi:6-pyruvoyltetrahydropterin/6-carboxytetrahydropterin synthase
MYEIEIITTFSAAHLLRDYRGKCEHLHGHNYRVHVAARAAAPGKGGMVIDFGELKRAANVVANRLDHTFLNDIEPFNEIEPSAENIAFFMFHEIAREMGEQADKLYSVSVWESDTSRATFFKSRPE